MSILKEAQRLMTDALLYDGSPLSTELFAWTVFGSYFALILVSFGLVFMSITDGVKWSKLLEGRAFYFVRASVAALGATWYFMLRFMQWSYQDHAARSKVSGGVSTIGKWLLDTPLFEQAWGEVCSSPAKWWWSSFICTWTVILTAVIWRESALRRIKYPWAYMLLGMSVAISVATALFITATFLHPRHPASSSSSTSSGAGAWARYAPVRLSFPLLLSLYTVYLTPGTVGTDGFLRNVLWMHGLLVLPLVLPNDPLPGADDGRGKEDGLRGRGGDGWQKEGEQTAEAGGRSESTTTGTEATTSPTLRPQAETSIRKSPLDIPFNTFLSLLLVPIIALHTANTLTLLRSIPASSSPTSPAPSLAHILLQTFLSHPAQASISSDVISTALILLSWLLCTGSLTSILLKNALALSLLAFGAVWVLGINWKLVASLGPIGVMFGVGLGFMGLGRVRGRNEERRRALMGRLGMRECEVQQGEKGRAPRRVGRRCVVGFWHPYCNAGGGGERVLWSAIAYTQRTQPNTVCLVYSGDYPEASKEAILGRAQDRFSITINPDKLVFIPLPSRFLIADNYWKRFTLLGQSLGSVYLAWEGLCGKDGMWGDVFIDTMGHGFTFPFVRLIAGPQIAIGAYVHYPTVSTDMVRRVREGLIGVESGEKGASRGWEKQVKLVYYSIFATLYATALLFCQEIMTNSSWTQAHIQSLLAKGKKSWLAGLLLMDDLSERKRRERGERGESDQAAEQIERCKVLFPPCDTGDLARFGLEGRGERRGIVSLAQFRPEKEHSKQLYALQILLQRYPEYRSTNPVKLTLMGGVRDEGDQKRLDGLKALAVELGIQDNVEFLANAPYPEVVRRLGEASLGLNTMQDEHFGINVVEFMAAGLIPIVHASAGPKLDIVVPHNGQQTGYHGTDAASFAEAIHAALSLPRGYDMAMRTAARDRAVEVFSQEAFERGWQGHWARIKGVVRQQAKERGEVLED